MLASKYDVVIVGGGVIGLAVALGLAPAGLNIAVIDAHEIEKKTPQQHRYDERVFALNHAAYRFLEDSGVWSSIAGVAAYQQMQLWAKGRQQLLDLQPHMHRYPALGYIVEHRAIHQALYQAVTAIHEITLVSHQTLTALDAKGQVTLANGQTCQASLVIGADGARSWVRENLRMPYEHYDYQQTALVMNVAHEKPHQQTAFQCFNQDKPLAYLPFSDPYHSAIVWSLPHAQATASMADETSTLLQALTDASEHILGNCELISAVKSFPLHRLHAKNYVKEKTVLIGDAAHVIHPMAGWGMNLGLMDAACLTSLVTHAVQQGENIANPRLLRHYERRRRHHNAGMLKLVHSLKQAFHYELPFSWVQSMASLKNAMIHIAQGEHRLLEIIK